MQVILWIYEPYLHMYVHILGSVCTCVSMTVVLHICMRMYVRIIAYFCICHVHIECFMSSGFINVDTGRNLQFFPTRAMLIFHVSMVIF